MILNKVQQLDLKLVWSLEQCQFAWISNLEVKLKCFLCCNSTSPVVIGEIKCKLRAKYCKMFTAVWDWEHFAFRDAATFVFGKKSNSFQPLVHYSVHTLFFPDFSFPESGLPVPKSFRPVRSSPSKKLNSKCVEKFFALNVMDDFFMVCFVLFIRSEVFE